MTKQVKLPVVVALLAMFADDNGKQDATRLAQFKTIIKTYSNEELTAAVRLKTKDEQYAPFVQSMCFTTDETGKQVPKKGLSPVSAGVRHSQLRTLVKACTGLVPFNIEGFSGYNPAIVAATAHVKTLREAAQVQRVNAKIGGEAARIAGTKEITPAIMAKAKAAVEQEATDKEAASKERKAIAAATEAGGFFIPNGKPAEISQALAAVLGKQSRAVANAFLTHVLATFTQEQKQAAPVEVAAPVANVEAVEV